MKIRFRIIQGGVGVVLLSALALSAFFAGEETGKAAEAVEDAREAVEDAEDEEDELAEEIAVELGKLSIVLKDRVETILDNLDSTESKRFKLFLEKENEALGKDPFQSLIFVTLSYLYMASVGNPEGSVVSVSILHEELEKTVLAASAEIAARSSFLESSEEEQAAILVQTLRKTFVKTRDELDWDKLTSGRKTFKKRPWIQEYADFCRAEENFEPLVRMSIALVVVDSVSTCDELIEAAILANYISSENEKTGRKTTFDSNYWSEQFNERFNRRALETLEIFGKGANADTDDESVAAETKSNRGTFQEGYELGLKAGFERLKKETETKGRIDADLNEIAMAFNSQLGSYLVATPNAYAAIGRRDARRALLRKERDEYVRKGYGSSFVQGYVKGYVEGEERFISSGEAGSSPNCYMLGVGVSAPNELDEPPAISVADGVLVDNRGVPLRNEPPVAATPTPNVAPSPGLMPTPFAGVSGGQAQREQIRSQIESLRQQRDLLQHQLKVVRSNWGYDLKAPTDYEIAQQNMLNNQIQAIDAQISALERQYYSSY